ncbi:MAG TPA: FimV/HubP family polar landmark protein [Luteibacter sp.]|uniref:FimV/HubP family polar landmark protein n=1 Tax=Luteibacter sp. TaxID=1886636 RepID=UPI002B9ADD64|nr:FimV/HubP family polar landmark protein [Luteibacter sp.]HVI55197.1 FimV/HubP family polar landmark protein [Luteibacter sp.]
MNRTLKLSIMLALATGGGHALAQDLGPVQVRSTMDQPLVAEIPLNGVSGKIDNVHVALASEEAFSRAGLNRGGLPVALSFAVGKNASGQPVIKVTSAAPVRDTYLDFLVEVSTDGNKVVREITMLLDPPGTPSSAAGTVASAPAAKPSRTSDVPPRVPTQSESRPSRSESATAPERATPAPSHARAAATPSGAGDSSVTVQRGQNLSTIARDHLSGADINQVLLALHKANPDAFYRDNINALKTGAVLRIPSADDVQAQSAAAALVEVRRQNEAWRSGAARSPSVVADAASTGATQAPAKAAAPANDRLAIVPSKDGGDAASTRAGSKDGKGDAQVAGLKQELSSSQESVASLKQQGAELKSRIGDLEEINTKNQRLISLKDSEIAELQRKLAETRKASGQPATAATVASPAAAAQAPAVAQPSPAAASTATAVAAAPAIPAHAATAASPAVVTTPIPAPAAANPAAVAKPPVHPFTPPAVVEEDPWYLQTWAWGGGAIVILLLLVAAVFGRRKTVAAGPASASLADRFAREPNFDTLGHNDAMDQDQREILDALAEHPDDIGLHLELVGLYYHRRDVEHFEAAAEAMFAHVADPEQPEWREVVTMGEDLAPSHPLFGGVPTDELDEPYEHEHEHGLDEHDRYKPGHVHPDDEAAALEKFDLGTYVTAADEEEHPAVPTPQKHSEYHFNFDLTPVQRAEAEHRPNAPDVFDVDAPGSLYTEVPTHGSSGHDAGNAVPLSDDRASWSFNDETEAAATSAHDLPRFDEPTFPDEEPIADHSPESFSDDPVDTKLDLARAYLDMGDAEGARLMLDEVMSEGTQMQKDTAKRILNDIV